MCGHPFLFRGDRERPGDRGIYHGGLGWVHSACDFVNPKVQDIACVALRLSSETYTVVGAKSSLSKAAASDRATEAHTLEPTAESIRLAIAPSLGAKVTSHPLPSGFPLATCSAYS